MKIERNEKWWLAKARHEGGAIGAGGSPSANLRAATLSTATPGRFISGVAHHIDIATLQSRACLDASLAIRRSVLVRTAKQLASVLALIELDGVANRIVLCPPDQDRHLSEIIQAAGIDLIITDPDMVDEHLPVTQLSVSAERLTYSVIDDRPAETEWVLLTSGTTGMPKLTIHTFASIAGPLSDGVLSSWCQMEHVLRRAPLRRYADAVAGLARRCVDDSIGC